MSGPIPSTEDPFLDRPVGRVFLTTAVPMAAVLTLSGLHGVIDAAILGRVVGAEAVAAVAMVFPAAMVAVALSTLAGAGAASLMGRALGGGDVRQSRAVFAAAQTLALALGVVAAGLLILGGAALLPHDPIGRMAWDYLWITSVGLPVQLLGAAWGDAARTEGRAGAVAGIMLAATAANGTLDLWFVAGLGWGVAGSAVATVAAQALALVLAIRVRGCARPAGARAVLALAPRIVALGLPVSLSFVGMALVSAVVLAVIGGTAEPLAAYGVVNRLLALAFLPAMAIGLAVQTVAGRNAGAGRQDRVRAALHIALLAALGWGLMVEAAVQLAPVPLVRLFVAEPAVVAEAVRQLRLTVAAWSLVPPVLAAAMWLQAQGRAAEAAVLTLARPFLVLPMGIVAFASVVGPEAIWLAWPAASLLLAGLAFLVVSRRPALVPA
ncbi:MATE family efflux transporter [Pseudoroseicyclus tamaricis]|uniref:MATE family efflux transporter n=1 Tax=Pseudoroseicyclus tamaricis TaxID=2705421 RepID=A0A6B2JQ58_9RHOB|nr:MATE family efflux transporter [Pseudoroseicyclus tamaricis]NDV00817.1 MATE family efflux transporter [Pseudoroseicyclus tamaricis]